MHLLLSRSMGNRATPPSLRLPHTPTHTLLTATTSPSILHAHHQLPNYIRGYTHEKAIISTPQEIHTPLHKTIWMCIYNPEKRNVHRERMEHALGRHAAKHLGRERGSWSNKYKKTIKRAEFLKRERGEPTKEVQNVAEVPSEFKTGDTFPTTLKLYEIESPILNAEILAQWIGRYIRLTERWDGILIQFVTDLP